MLDDVHTLSDPPDELTTKFFHPNFERLREICERGNFSTIPTDCYCLIQKLVPFPALLFFIGWPLIRNQQCFAHQGATRTSLSFFRHRETGVWMFACNNHSECGVHGDVIEFWFRIVLGSGRAPVGWSRPRAATDLLRRVRLGEIDIGITEFKGESTAARTRHARAPREDEYWERLKGLVADNKGAGGVLLVNRALPKPVKGISVRDVLRGLFPVDGYLLLTPKKRWHDIETRDYWLANYSKVKPPVPARSFISSSYLVRNDVHCSYAAFDQRRWLVVESDTGSLEEQFAIHAQLSQQFGNLGCVCLSGGKSLHAWFLVDGWGQEQCFELYASAIRLGVSDINTWRICQPIRLPNGWNHKTGRKQSIIL